MKKVLLIQGFSDLTRIIIYLEKRNIVPDILVYEKDVSKKYSKIIDGFLKKYPKNIKIIKKDCSYKQLVKTLRPKKYDEILHISEFNVETASKLSTELHIPGNPYSKVRNFLEKEYMQKALKDHGIRYIRGEKAKSVDEIIKIYHKFGDKPIVIKPSRGAGSVTMKFCKTLEDIKSKTKGFFTEKNMLTDNVNTEALVQEWIFGREYIVNTQVIRGKSFLQALGKYEMVDWNNVVIYRNCEYLSNNDCQDISINNLIQYAFATNKAVGVENGFVHSEFYIDEKGPILIEVNCRLMGGPFEPDYLTDSMTYAQGEVYSNALLFPETYDEKVSCGYKVNDENKINLIFLLSPYEGKIKSWPYRALFKNLKTFAPKYNNWEKLNRKLIKTVDFETLAGRVYLKGNEIDVQNDDRFIKILNDNYFYMLYELEKEPKLNWWIPKGISTVNFIKSIYKSGPVLFINDQNKKMEYVKSTNLKNLSSQLNNYLYVVLNLKNKLSLNREQTIDKIFEVLSKVRIGGFFFVPNECVQLFPYGNSAYEIICKIAGFQPIDPKENIGGFLAKKVK